MLLFSSAVVVLLATASTSSARFAARTDNSSNTWTAADLNLDVNTSHDLFLDGAGLYPGLELENCIIVTYTGSLDGVDVSVHAKAVNGGLERFFDLNIDVGGGSSTDCSDFRSNGEPAFEGTLRTFADRHGSIGTGLLLADDVASGSAVTVRVSGSVIDDNGAQGLDGRFIATIEARP